VLIGCIVYAGYLLLYGSSAFEMKGDRLDVGFSRAKQMFQVEIIQIVPKEHSGNLTDLVLIVLEYPLYLFHTDVISIIDSFLGYFGEELFTASEESIFIYYSLYNNF
jgi:hypothetical protein